MAYMEFSFMVDISVEFAFEMLTTPSLFKELEVPNKLNIKYEDTPSLQKEKLEIGDEFIFIDNDKKYYMKFIAKTENIIKEKIIKYNYTCIEFLDKAGNDFENMVSKTQMNHNLSLINKNKMTMTWTLHKLSDEKTEVVNTLEFVNPLNFWLKIGLKFGKKKDEKIQKKYLSDFMVMLEKRYKQKNYNSAITQL